MVRLARGLTLRIWWTLKFCSKAFNKTTPSRLAYGLIGEPPALAAIADAPRGTGGLSRIDLDHVQCSENSVRRDTSWRWIMKKLSVLGIIVGAAALVAAPISVNWPSEDHAVVTINSADAKVGKPLSATSVAGVNRRQGRREQRKGN
jgi:hypothetical protein